MSTPDDAEGFLEEAVGLFHQLGQPGEEAHALVARAMLRWRQGRIEDADRDAPRPDARRSQRHSQRSGHSVGRDRPFSLDLGAPEETISRCTAALEIDIALGDDYYAAVVLDALGLIYAAMGRRADAEAAWKRSLALLEYLEHPQATDVRARLGGVSGGESRSGTGLL